MPDRTAQAKRPAVRAVRTGVYMRISDDREGMSLGVKRQAEDCEALAARKGWDVVAKYEDNDQSAYSARRVRPAYQRLVDDVRAGANEAVIVYRLDRLHRRPVELEQFMTLADAHGIRLASVAGDVDLGTPEGRLYARIMGSTAAHEGELKAARTRRKHEELAKAGQLSGGGTRPMGYQADRITINAPEAKLIRAAVKAALGGASVRSIAEEWGRRGVRSPAGNVMGPNALRRLLRSGRIAGLREHHGEIVGPAVWKPLISKLDHERIRGMLSDPSRLTRRPGRKYLLGGFVRCGKCGELLKSRPATTGTRLYICKTGPGAKGCGGIGIVAEKLEELVVEQVMFRVDTPALAKAIAEQHRAVDVGSADDIAADEAQLIALANMHAQRRISQAEWLAARDVVQARLDDARRRLARQNGTEALGGYVGRAGALRKAWATMDLEARRAVLRALIDRIVIAPAKKKNAPADAKGRRLFDPERVSVEWRF